MGVENIEGSLRHPQDFRYTIQNFSVSQVNTSVAAGEQVSFVYNFKPSESFDPRDIGLVVNVHYVDEDSSSYRDCVFNDTIGITDADTTISKSTIVNYSFIALCIVAAYFYFRNEAKPTVSFDDEEDALNDFLPENLRAHQEKKKNAAK